MLHCCVPEHEPVLRLACEVAWILWLPCTYQFRTQCHHSGCRYTWPLPSKSLWCSISSMACLLPHSPILLVTRTPSPESRLFSPTGPSSDRALVISPWIILFIGLPASSPNLSPSPLSTLLPKCLLLKRKSDHGLPLF